MTLAGTLLATALLLLGEPPLPDRPDRRPPTERVAPVFAPAQAAPEPAPDAGTPRDGAQGSGPAPGQEGMPSPRQLETRPGPPLQAVPAPLQPRTGTSRWWRLPATLAGAGALGTGGAAWLTEVGYPVLALTYAQGIGPEDDLGGTARVSWTTGEMLLGVLWRRELWRDGSATAFRLVAGPWFDFGATWIYPDNEANVGLQVAPGIAWTLPAGEGLVSFGADLALTLAFQRGMGVAVGPRLGVAYEVPVAADVTLGARVELWIRGGTGGASIPGLDGRVQGALGALVMWRVF